ncbi:hypothetical protein RUM44_000172 [Polyplax serrata]|uniref:Large ribosomal subunit protein uL29m n=1 Tax=Polyplax serrata TaxID=468196 RepID=A0ABR1B4Q0_POLSC
MSLCRCLNRICIHPNNLLTSQTARTPFLSNRILSCVGPFTSRPIRGLQTSCLRQDLMEFFDDKENWGQREVKVGRSWKVEELRIKSNSDLHKLWYVLLKEKNMLLTMEHEYNQKFEPFPNPERIDKVNESMENLETVVRERNRAYFELETGESGERPKGEATNCFGLTYTYRLGEFPVPKHMNSKFLADEKLFKKTDDYKYISKFLTRLKEKKSTIQYCIKMRRYAYVCSILKRFPNAEEALKEQFPDIDIEEAKKDKRSRGHRENLY